MSLECYLIIAALWYSCTVIGCLFNRKTTTPGLAVLSLVILAVVALIWPAPAVGVCLRHGYETGFLGDE
jgi:hypothetical protein